MPIEPIDWKGAWTLDDYVISLFEKKRTDSVEFKLLLRIYGRERLAKIWEEFKSKGGIKSEHYSTRSQCNQVENSEGTTESQAKKESAKKASSFVARSMPDDDF